MKRSAARTTGMLAVSILIAVFAVAPVAIAADDDVNLCHATNSDKNPYEEKTVPQSAIFNDGHIVDRGHGTHYGGVFGASGSAQWGDIIPAFGLYGGLNVVAGQAWVDRGCEPPPKLTLVKVVDNTDGGTAAATAWTLHAAGTTSFEGTTPAIHAVEAGTYALSETGGPSSGYDPSLWNCDNTTVDGTTVTFGIHDVTDVTCTITNTFVPTTTPHMVDLTLLKVVENAGGGTAAETDWTLDAVGTTQGTTPFAGASTPAADSVAEGTYTLSETSGPSSEYDPSLWNCDNTEVDGTTVTIGSTDEDVTCTITNTFVPTTTPHMVDLTLLKVVENAGGGTAAETDWTLDAVGTTSETTAFDGASTPATDAVAEGTYTLSETSGPSSEYDPSLWNCDNTEVDGTTVTIGSTDEDVTCTITNTFVPTTTPHMVDLTLLKVVENAGGGTVLATAWTLDAVGTTSGTTAFDGASTPATDAVAEGTYTLSETSGPSSGYDPSLWNCDNTEVDGTTVTIGSTDEDVTCTITNTFVPQETPLAQLTLVKEVVNAFGEPADATAWTLRAAGSTTFEGGSGTASATHAVAAGSYTLSEFGGPSGYSASDWYCSNDDVGPTIIISSEDTAVTCTITNTFVPTTTTQMVELTLVKVVVGGNTSASAWTLDANDGTTSFAEGPTGTHHAVAAGNYILSESGPSGYTGSDWVCPGAGVSGDRGSQMVTIGTTDVTCTITNTFVSTQQPVVPVDPTVQPKITLKAEVVNDAGGTAQVSDFTLTGSSIEVTHEEVVQDSSAMVAAAATTSFSGVTGAAAITNAVVPVGTYFLSESALPSGYSASAWACTGGQLDGSAITVAIGNTVECVITNTYSSTVVDSPGVPTADPASPPPAVVVVEKAAPRATTPAVTTPTVTTLAFTGAEPVPSSLLALLALVLGVAMTVAGRRLGGHWARE